MAFGLTPGSPGEAEVVVGVAYCDESDPASPWNVVVVPSVAGLKPPPFSPPTPSIPFPLPAPALDSVKADPPECFLEDPTTHIPVPALALCLHPLWSSLLALICILGPLPTLPLLLRFPVAFESFPLLLVLLGDGEPASISDPAFLSDWYSAEVLVGDASAIGESCLT